MISYSIVLALLTENTPGILQVVCSNQSSKPLKNKTVTHFLKAYETSKKIKKVFDILILSSWYCCYVASVNS